MALRLPRSNPPIVVWIGAAFGAASCITAATLLLLGAHEHGTVTALRATARLCFLLFWMAYAGGPLADLFGAGFQPLKRHSRELGLSFAAAQTVHVGLIVWLCWIGAAPAAGVFRFFAGPLACIYILAVFSIGGLQRRLSPLAWWFIRFIAMNYIAYAFATDFFRDPFGGGFKRIALYLPFAALSAAGFALYAAALAVRWKKGQGALPPGPPLRTSP
jgi:hypothetical protein